jgi:hypothetical protein
MAAGFRDDMGGCTGRALVQAAKDSKRTSWPIGAADDHRAGAGKVIEAVKEAGSGRFRPSLQAEAQDYGG